MEKKARAVLPRKERGMTQEEAIKSLQNIVEYWTYKPTEVEAAKMAIAALEEIQLYKDNKLCLVPEDVYSRQCSELDAYKEIGTVEECREAVERQKAKKPVLRNDNGKLRKSCPVCGCFFSPLSRSCPKCGQAIDNENLEGMEDE